MSMKGSDKRTQITTALSVPAYHMSRELADAVGHATEHASAAQVVTTLDMGFDQNVTVQNQQILCHGRGNPNALGIELYKGPNAQSCEQAH
jgi:hypothetical protein